MTHKSGNVVFIYEESPQQCDYCGKICELRPYGKNDAKICHECANKPENYDETLRHIRELFG